MKKSNLTPLGASALAFMLGNRGFDLSKSVKQYIGNSSTASGSLNSTIHGAVLSARIASKALLDAAAAVDPSAPPDPASNYTPSTHQLVLKMGENTIPALMNTNPPSLTDPDSVTGFTGNILQTAISEVRIGDGRLATLVGSIMLLHSYMDQQNDMIIPLYHAKDHMQHLFSNIDDLITSDITGVNKATFLWGTDLVKSGRVIDLKTISTFGLPSNLLFTIRDNNGQTSSLSAALVLSGLLPDEINAMFDSRKASIDQEKKLYNAFSMIQNSDLSDVLIPLNCQTKGLTSLADLLNPQKLFPDSYQSLTVPEYNKVDLPTNSKTYYLIYQNGTTDKFLSLAEYAIGIIPTGIATACAALSYSMRQIKNIQDMKIEKFAQMVVNMESSNDLGLGLTSSPANQSAINSAHSLIAVGSQSDGSFIFDDFFGAATGLRSEYEAIKNGITDITTTTLTTLLIDLNTALEQSPIPTTIDSEVSSIVAEIELELSSIKSANSTKEAALTALWNAQANRMIKAKAHRIAAFTGISFNEIPHGVSDVSAFTYSLKPYAMNTLPYDSSAVIESITDGTESGDTIIGYMRECRNTARINSAGGLQDNEIEVPIRINTNGDTIAKPNATAVLGSLAGNNESNLIPPNLDIYNMSHLSGNPLTVKEAIENVIECNCDCWDLLSG
jgi:hypothetical protein